MFLKCFRQIVFWTVIVCSVISFECMMGAGAWARESSRQSVDYGQDISQHLFDAGDYSGGLERCLIEVSRDPLAVESFENLISAIDVFVSRFPENVSAIRASDKARYCLFLARQIRSYVSHLKRIEGPIDGIAIRQDASDFFQIDMGQTRIVLADDVIDWQSGMFYLDHMSAYLSGVLDHIKHRYQTVQRSVLSSRVRVSLDRKERQQEILNDELSVITEKLHLREALVDGLLIHIDELQDQVDHLQLSFDVVEERLKNVSVHADLTAHQMAGVSMELYAKEKQIVDRDERFEKMLAELNELKERSGLMQRIMEEKDVRIARLESEVADMAEEKQTEDLAQREDLKNVKAQVVSLRAMFKEKSMNYQAFVDDLESQMSAVLKEKKNLVTALRQKAQEAALLSLAVKDYDKRLSDMDIVVLSKDKKLMELQGMVDLYRLMLKDLQKQLDELELENRRIQERMTFLNSYTYALQARSSAHQIDGLSALLRLSELRDGETGIRYNLEGGLHAR